MTSHDLFFSILGLNFEDESDDEAENFDPKSRNSNFSNSIGIKRELYHCIHV